MSEFQETIHEAVKAYYAERASTGGCCGGEQVCGPGLYPLDELAELPSEVRDFSLGCGNPLGLADLQPGESVLDLGSGGGLDCILAAERVGATGHVIGVDMTPEMITRARAAVDRLGLKNIEYRLGNIEDLPVADASVDVVLSNCVINLAPDKRVVFGEIYRVLKPGGRIALSDVIRLTGDTRTGSPDLQAWSGCVAGAIDWQNYQSGLQAVGFIDLELRWETQPPAGTFDWIADRVRSGLIRARKPTSGD